MAVLLRAILGALLMVVGLAGTVTAQSRHALVIGIDSYQNVPSLQKARNDADAIAGALSQLGFAVTELRDADRRSLNQGISAFTAAIEPGDEAVFYFAGHGIEVAGRNYLLPADIPAARPGDEEFVMGESIAVDRVLQAMQGRGARVSLLILDACRDNPFPPSGTRSLGMARGLARVDPPEGAFILFSAGTGQTALDRLSNADPNPNSVFTRALLPRLYQPGMSIHELTQAVRNDVRAMAKSVNHDQFPAYYDQLSGVFAFNADGSVTRGAAPLEGTATGTPTSQTMGIPALAPVITDPCEAARGDWQAIQTTTSTAALEAFAQVHSACALYAALAAERLTALATPPAPPPLAQSTAPTAGDSCDQLWYARNLIYHEKGFCFTSAKAKSVFDTSACTTSNPVLSAAEKKEVERIKALEKAKGC